jgi:acetylornithine deacetylase
MAIFAVLLAFVSLQLANAAPQASISPTAMSTAASSPSTSTQSTSLTAEETNELFSLHEEMVSIPSISEHEVECAEFLSEYLTNLGYYVEEVPVGDSGTFNVFAYPQELKDEGVWPEVLITSHIDTVRAVPNIHRKCYAFANVSTGPAILSLRTS